MREATESKGWRWFQNYLRVSAGVILALLFYTGWIMNERYREKSDVDVAAAAARNAKERDEATRTYAALGGAEFGILNFYASPSPIRRGNSATVFYGVSNAASVRLDPPAAPVWPSVSRCFDVSPKKTTTYKLTIEDSAGHSKESALTVEVRVN